jgi:hypothetical protein
MARREKYAKRVVASCTPRPSMGICAAAILHQRNALSLNQLPRAAGIRRMGSATSSRRNSGRSRPTLLRRPSETVAANLRSAGLHHRRAHPEPVQCPRGGAKSKITPKRWAPVPKHRGRGQVGRDLAAPEHENAIPFLFGAGRTQTQHPRVRQAGKPRNCSLRAGIPGENRGCFSSCCRETQPPGRAALVKSSARESRSCALAKLEPNAKSSKRS